jgi:hypothetical protein
VFDGEVWQKDESIELNIRYGSLANAMLEIKNAADQLNEGADAELEIDYEDYYGTTSIICRAMGQRPATDEEVLKILKHLELTAANERSVAMAAKRELERQRVEAAKELIASDPELVKKLLNESS